MYTGHPCYSLNINSKGGEGKSDNTGLALINTPACCPGLGTIPGAYPEKGLFCMWGRGGGGGGGGGGLVLTGSSTIPILRKKTRGR